MNYQDTKSKVIAWCEALHKQGIINEADLDNCRKSYTTLGQGIDLGVYTDARTSKEFSFAMLDGQGETDTIRDLTKRKQFKCMISNIDMDKYIAIRPNIPGQLQLTDDSLTNMTKAGNEAQIIFLIQLQQNGYYTIQHITSGNYITVDSSSKILLCNTNIITDAGNFKMSQSSSKTYSFESAKYPGNYIIEANPLTVSNTGNKYWNLDIITTESSSESNSGTTNEESKALINALLIKINNSRLEYYTILAQIEFLTLLRDKMYNLVKSQGDIMNYYYEKKDTRQLDISEDLLKYIQFSINNELRAHEGSQIDDMINELIMKAKDIEAGDYTISNEKSSKLIQLLKSQIAEKREQITGLNSMIEKVSAQQRELNNRQDGLEKKADKYDSKREVVDTNYNFTQAKEAGYEQEFKIIIGVSIILLALIGFFGYKLWSRFKTVILDS